jgi:hypothetical protein
MIVDPFDASVKRSMAFTFSDVSTDRVLNTSFWMLAFKLAVHPDPRFGTEFFYTRLIPYLVSAPLLTQVKPEIAEWRQIPTAGDHSFVNCALESLRHIARLMGLPSRAAGHLPMLAYWNVMNFVRNDMEMVRSLSEGERGMIHIAIKTTGNVAGAQGYDDGQARPAQLNGVLQVLIARLTSCS